MTRTVLPFRRPAEWNASAGRIAEHLVGGGLLVHPTETVYGIGCALLERALADLGRVKARPGPFLVLVHEAPVARTLWSDDALQLARAFWPGPLTIIVRARPDAFPDDVLGPVGTIAVRATSHPGMQEVLRTLGEPVTSTSANEPGGAPEVAFDAVQTLVERLDPDSRMWLLDAGDLPPALPSTLVDCSARPPRVLRKGATGVDELREVIDGIEEA